jgi:hypothetical protein
MSVYENNKPILAHEFGNHGEAEREKERGRERKRERVNLLDEKLDVMIT